MGSYGIIKRSSLESWKWQRNINLGSKMDSIVTLIYSSFSGKDFE